MKFRIFLFIIFFAGAIMAWDNYRDFNQDLASGRIYNTFTDKIYFQITFNTPDYVFQYYNYLADKMGLSEEDKSNLIHRKVSYAERYLWFNVVAKAGSMQELVWNNSDFVYIITDMGMKFYPEVMGPGTYPKYRPIEVDGHIYDKICWEKSFGIRFPLSILDTNCSKETFKMVSAFDNKVLGVWDVQKLRKLYKIEERVVGGEQ